MIGLDTNVLVRHVTHDDAAQTESVERFLATLTRSDPGFVSLATILELVWTLQRTYQFDLESVARYVFGLLASDEIVVQAPDVRRRAPRTRACSGRSRRFRGRGSRSVGH